MARVFFAACLCILRGAVAQNSGDLQLDGSSFSSAGALGIYLSEQWGTISAVNFSKDAADVACHQLGYSEALSFTVATSSTRTGPVWLAGPNCTGDELHVLRCEWSESPCDHCSHGDDVSIQCNTTLIWKNPYEGSVRLYQPNGQLLVYLKGLWGAVCADHFTKAEADSVCRQLGYTDSNGYQSTGEIGYMWLKDFDCSASEPCFTNCYDYPVNSSWITDCSSVDATAGVSCEYNTSADWSPGTHCWHQSPSNTSSTATTSTSAMEQTTTATMTPTPAFSSTVAISNTIPTSSMEQTTPATVTPTSAFISSTHIVRSSVTSVPVATSSVLPSSNPSTSLSKGAIAGIVIGSTLGLLVVIIIVAACICFAKPAFRRHGYKQVQTPVDD